MIVCKNCNKGKQWPIFSVRFSADNDKKLQTIVHYDQIGRTKLEQYSDGMPLSLNNEGIMVKTIYEHFSGVSRVITSSPYRATTDATLQWKCTQYDTAGRVVPCVVSSVVVLAIA